uniref:Uncharacterized protein n=1 Tax=Nelumbo nucifera TaxID=4432 RepID=A0A822ZUG1_NELNU|nr:TPA_asm: hypothetical protein HUJ06_017098 [Nelumbo nucifera]
MPDLIESGWRVVDNKDSRGILYTSDSNGTSADLHPCTSLDTGYREMNKGVLRSNRRWDTFSWLLKSSVETCAPCPHQKVVSQKRNPIKLFSAVGEPRMLGGGEVGSHDRHGLILGWAYYLMMLKLRIYPQINVLGGRYAQRYTGYRHDKLKHQEVRANMGTLIVKRI